MPAHLKRALYWLVALSISIVLLYLSVRGISWNEFIGTLQHMQFSSVVNAVLLFSISCFLRSIRWRILLRPAHTIGLLPVFWATMIGYMGNYFLPARAGELIRTVVVSRQSGLTKSYVLATVLIERVVDIVVLVIVAAIVLQRTEHVPDWLAAATQVTALVGSSVLLGTIIAPQLNAAFERWLRRSPIKENIVDRLSERLASFSLGLKVLHHVRRFAAFAVASAVIWLLDASLMIVIASGLGLTLTLAQALLLLAALGLSSAIPSTPGMVGVYQFVAVAILTPLGFEQSQALAQIIVFQAITTVIVAIWGVLGIWRVGRSGISLWSWWRTPIELKKEKTQPTSIV